MRHIELIGRQSNDREARIDFPMDEAPQSVDEWIEEARKRGINFDEEKTRERGVIVGQHSILSFLPHRDRDEPEPTIEDFEYAMYKTKRLMEETNFNQADLSRIISSAARSVGLKMKKPQVIHVEVLGTSLKSKRDFAEKCILPREMTNNYRNAFILDSIDYDLLIEQQSVRRVGSRSIYTAVIPQNAWGDRGNWLCAVEFSVNPDENL